MFRCKDFCEKYCQYTPESNVDGTLLELLVKEYVQQWGQWNGEYRNNAAIVFDKPSNPVKQVLCLNQYDELTGDKAQVADSLIQKLKAEYTVVLSARQVTGNE